MLQIGFFLKLSSLNLYLEAKIGFCTRNSLIFLLEASRNSELLENKLKESLSK